ncbi:MAG: hypothetical protein D6729_18245, partial [Deltaproteobacteria bacterium]
MPPAPLTRPFSHIRATDLPLVGGKGANLGEMAAAGLPIPQGFCVTTAAFRRFVQACPQAERLYAKLDALSTEDMDAVRDLGARQREALLAGRVDAIFAKGGEIAAMLASAGDRIRLLYDLRDAEPLWAKVNNATPRLLTFSGSL